MTGVAAPLHRSSSARRGARVASLRRSVCMKRSKSTMLLTLRGSPTRTRNTRETISSRRRNDREMVNAQPSGFRAKCSE